MSVPFFGSCWFLVQKVPNQKKRAMSQTPSAVKTREIVVPSQAGLFQNAPKLVVYHSGGGFKGKPQEEIIHFGAS